MRRFAAVLSVLLGLVLPAHAQVFRAYLSVNGSDANPCTLPAPCRLLPAALAAVQAGGEIWMLDSANFNTSTVTVAKGVTILAIPGALGSVVANGGDALVIATGDIVTLRNLNVLPLAGSTSTTGVRVAAPAQVVLDGCTIAGFFTGGGYAVRAELGSTVSVVRSALRRNRTGVFASNANVGIRETSITGSFTAVDAVMEALGPTTVVRASRAYLRDNTIGFQAAATIAGAAVRFSVSESQMESNGTAVSLSAVQDGSITATLDRNGFVGNDTAVALTGSSGVKARLAGNTVADHGFAIQQDAGTTLESAGDNAFGNNFNEGTGGMTTVARK